MFDIDYKGGNQLIAGYPDHAVAIFVLPPSMEELARRLRARGTDSAEVVNRRLQNAREELEHFSDYHYLVVNDDLETAYKDVRTIYRARTLSSRRQSHLVETLLEEARGIPHKNGE